MILSELFFRYVTASLLASVWIFLLYVTAAWRNRTYTAKTSYLIWLLLACYLLAPVKLSFLKPQAELRISEQAVTLYQMTVEQERVLWERTQQTLPVLSEEQAAASEKTPFAVQTAWIWLFGVWIFTGATGFRYVWQRRQLFRWSRLPQNPAIAALQEELAKELGMQACAPVFICEKVKSPICMGCLHPTIFLPDEQMEIQLLAVVLRHELVHVKRKDIWYQMLLLAVRLIHWYQPFAYLMCRCARADMERCCDDTLLEGQSYAYRRAYSETILAVMQHQRHRTLMIDFYGGVAMLKERFRNILDVRKKRYARGTCMVFCLLLVAANSVVDCAFSQERRTDEKQTITVKQEKQNLDLQLQEFTEQFINEFQGTIAGQQEIDLNFYIENQNLKTFAEWMLTLTQKQLEMGGSQVLYGDGNIFSDFSCEPLEKNLYYVCSSFQQQGSGITCQLLMKKKTDRFVIQDFYFGAMDGIDTFATGHAAERTVTNPDLWNEEAWVTHVFEKLLEYEGELADKERPPNESERKRFCLEVIYLRMTMTACTSAFFTAWLKNGLLSLYRVAYNTKQNVSQAFC